MSFLFIMLLMGQVVVDPYRFSSTPAPTYLINQNFEGAGYDNGETWTESGAGTRDEDYTGVVLSGSQSFRMVTSGANLSTYTSFSANSTVYGYFLFRPVSNTGAYRLCSIRDNAGGSGNAVCYIIVNADGTVGVRAGSAGTVNTVGTVSNGTTYHVWLTYTKGTGANGFGSVAFSTDGIKPTSGNNYAEHTNGNATADGEKIMIGTDTAHTFEAVVDRVLVDDEPIGDNP